MPFPVSNSSSAAPALPCDPLACANLAGEMGAPASETFDALLVSKGGPAGQAPAGETKTEANPTLTVNSASLARGRAATGEGRIDDTADGAEPLETEPAAATDNSAAESPADAVLRYQLIAGEWLVQPAPTPLPTDISAEARATSLSTEIPADANSTAPSLLREAQQRNQEPATGQPVLANPAAAAGLGSQNTAVAEHPTLHPAQQRPENPPAATNTRMPGGHAAQQVAAGSIQSAAGNALPSPSAAVSTNPGAAAPASTPVASVNPTLQPQPGAALPFATASTAPHPSHPAAGVKGAEVLSSSKPAGDRTAGAVNPGSYSEAALPAPANLAARAAEQAPADYSGGYSSEQRKDYRALVSNSKALVKPVTPVGTTAATGENTMATAAASSSSFAAPSAHPSVAALKDPAVSTSPELALTSVAESAATHAPRLVHEIRDISERVSGIDRNTVEVQFDFNDQDRLSVRVEYRDGTVHTTFRTDSPELRDTIAREWVTQAAADNRSFRSADPVFSSTTSGQQNLSSRDSHDQRQQAFAQTTPAFLHANAHRSTGAEAPASSTVPAVRRPETSVHLHTFA